jgi:hypothetical protein
MLRVKKEVSVMPGSLDKKREEKDAIFYFTKRRHLLFVNILQKSSMTRNQNMWVTENSVIPTDRSEKSVNHICRSGRSIYVDDGIFRPPHNSGLHHAWFFNIARNPALLYHVTACLLKLLIFFFNIIIKLTMTPQLGKSSSD